MRKGQYLKHRSGARTDINCNVKPSSANKHFVFFPYKVKVKEENNFFWLKDILILKSTDIFYFRCCSMRCVNYRPRLYLLMDGSFFQVL